MKEHSHTPGKEEKKLGQPDPDTLGKTDPQEHMEGPVSSVVQKVKEGTEDSAGQSGDGKDYQGKKK